MDSVTLSIIGGLATSSKAITDLVQSITDKSKKAQLEIAKERIDLAKAQLEAVSQDRDDLKRKIAELKEENELLSERVAHHELSVDYDIKDGLLYKKGTGEGPYCQVDQYQMTLQGYLSGLKCWACPKCRHEARTEDPSAGGNYVGVGGDPFGNY